MRADRLVMGIVLIGGVLQALEAHPATVLQVSTTEDVIDPHDGVTSLREAIDAVNASDDEGNIILEGTREYRLTLCALSDDDANRNGDLDHLSNGLLTISGNKATIRQTCPSARVIDQFGAGQLNVNDVTVMGGDAATEPGGGIFVRGLGGLNVKNSNIYGNKSAGAGGGIASQGEVILTGSNVTLNFARELGAGVATFTSLTLINSTVSGNTVGEQSPIGIGGVAAERSITLIYSTIQDNTPPNLDVRSGVLSAFGSVVAAPRGGGPACGTVGKGARSWGYNFSSDGSCGFGGGPGDRTEAGDPGLGPQPGVGIVPIVHPLRGSPLIDAIPASACEPDMLPAGVTPPWANLEADMRGVARPQGGACDMGAIEAVFDEPSTAPAAAPVAARAATKAEPPASRVAEEKESWVHLAIAVLAFAAGALIF